MLRYTALLPWLAANRRGDAETVSTHGEGGAADLREVGALDCAAALRRLDTSALGLSASEVVRRREKYGENKLDPERKTSFVVQLMTRLLNPLVVLLVTLAVVSLLMRDQESAIIILAMVLLSITLGLVQERKSSRAAEKLRAMVHTTAP
jgi:Mg2+-importing ATPase